MLTSRTCIVPLTSVLEATTLTNARQIRVTVAAKNNICIGDFSKRNLDVKITEVTGLPGIVKVVKSTVETQSGDLKIEWEKPDNGFEVKSFTI